MARGTDLIQWQCNKNGDQQWAMVPVGDGSGAVRVTNLKAQKCLGIQGGGANDGVKAIIWDCNDNNDQHWYMDHYDGSDYFRLVNQNGLCLGILGADTRWGAQAIQWRCNGGNDQKWWW
ncbi:hypothetical protein VR44_36485 [Streptomyces katrae]|uniref:Ricin B lectin domain-containing protein n=1 Tax=Streptomyces katrae TaxID=68223 RepID=A0A0F4IRE5_9ACTN|nr:hypothetical protein VR44_36485 [Streptomyces katrae]